MTMTETPIPDEALLVGVVAWPRSTFIYLRDHGGQSWLLPLAVRLVAQPVEKTQAEADPARPQFVQTVYGVGYKFGEAAPPD